MRNCAAAAVRGPMWVEPSRGLGRKLPHAYTQVANSTSHGTRRAKTDGGVLSSSNPPRAPPIRLMMNSARNDSVPTPETRLRPATPEVTCPGNSATVDVMLAASGGIPDRISAGNVMNEPPPASVFCRPAHRPAARMRASSMRERSADTMSHARAGACAWRSTRGQAQQRPWLEERLEPELAELASDARLLEAAERRHRFMVQPVDQHPPREQA